ncbi:MAG TPA: NADH-quinone oxidoreductase subunit N [Candidatus Polarisedimenticolaceae bacterium]|nr:NADH-quinone oxidoreductase subunit N [Candidatus Polarisedimenticolaceae bacterium]
MALGPASLEIATLALAFLVLAWDLIEPARESAGRRGGLYALAAAGLVLILLGSERVPLPGSLTDAFVLDPFALLVKRILLATALLAVAGLHAHTRARGIAWRSGEALVLLLFATVGGMALVSARELLTLFVAFELLSLPLYVLTALEKERRTAAEGAIKMFLFGSVSSAVLLLGIALLAAGTGTTFWMRVAAWPHDPIVRLGAALVVTGFGFKLAAFPFSLWAPDTYQSAPAPVVAFLSVAPKAAAVAALFRLVFEMFGPAGIPVGSWIAVLAGGTMLVGNLLALRQRDLKRLLAYSGIAQIGYVLAALAAGTRLAAGLSLFYFVAYLAANAGAFLVVAAMEAAGEEPTLHGARNLVRRSPVLASSMLVFLLSLGGIPFALGFWGKMYVFLAAADAGLWWLVTIGALLAVVALFYYLTIARWMFIVRDEGPALTVPAPLAAAIIACAIVAGAGGLIPQRFAEPALRAVDAMTNSSSR